MVRSLFTAGLAALFTAAPAPGTQVRFLGSDPIGPLAVGRGGVVKTPEGRACRTWGPVGSRWRELDALGRIAGEVIVKGREYYEVSRCDELRVRRVSGHRGAGVYVDAYAPYRSPRVASWQPDQEALAAMETLVRDRQRGIKNLDPALHVPLAQRVLTFEWLANGERYAVVGGTSLIVLVFRQGRWSVAHEQKPEKMRSQDEGYRALAVTDMNDDGRPEIVVHHKEEQGEWYGDFTLSLDADGNWREIGPGIFGSTA